MRVRYKDIQLPSNIIITQIGLYFNIFNKNNLETDFMKLKIRIPFFLNFNLNISTNIITFFIKAEFLNYKASKMMYYTFVSQFIHKVKGISELYRGVINIQGLGYSCAVTKLKNNKYNLFFRFGFKDKYNYIMPKNIIIEKFETVKTKMVIFCYSLELLKKVQIDIQRLRYPKAFKLQGIYLNDIFPKVKKFIK